MRILFIITLTACLFYISQAKAHTEWITKKESNIESILDDMTMDIIDIIFHNMPDILDALEKELRDRKDERYKCWLQPKEYRNKDCPPRYVQPMTNETD